MGLLTFFFMTWAGRILGLVISLVVLAGVFVAAALLLAVSGGPDPCTPGGGPITVSDANSDAFQQKWDSFIDTLDGGSATFVTFNESELTSRAVSWLEEEDLDFESDVRICVHEGFGEFTATLDGPGFLNMDVKIKGNVELVGEHPIADIDDIDIGNVPGFFIAPFEELVEDGLQEALDKIELEDHTYSVTLNEGEAIIGGQP